MVNFLVEYIFFFAPDQQPDLIHQYYMTHQRAVLLSLCTRWERRCLNDCKQCERMGQYLNETHSLAERRPARPPHITHEQHVCFFRHPMEWVGWIEPLPYIAVTQVFMHIFISWTTDLWGHWQVFFYSLDLDVMPARNIILFLHVWSDQWGVQLLTKKVSIKTCDLQ